MKLTREYLLDRVSDTQFFRVGNTTTTICALTLDDGFVVVGSSECIDPDEFNKKIGEGLAFEDALKKLWSPLGYAAQLGLNKENS